MEPISETTTQSEHANDPSSGKLKIFLGYASGVGKTYKMLTEALQERDSGKDVIIGSLEPNQWEDTIALGKSLDIVPRLPFEQRGSVTYELDLDGIIQRHPQIAVIDELAHTNSAGMRHPDRYQDVHELLESGIDVYTTLNIQNLESVQDIIRQIAGVSAHDMVPDQMLDNATEIELVDLPPEALLDRLHQNQGFNVDWKLYRKGNLIAFRQLALRAAAGWVDVQMREYMNHRAIPGPWAASERLLVAISSHPLSQRLVRVGRRLAGTLQAEWFVVYVETPDRVKYSPTHSARVASTLKLAESLGAKVVTIQGHSVPEAIVDFAHQHNITKIIAGKPKRPRWYEFLSGSVINEIIRRSGSIDVYVINDETGQITLALPDALHPRETLKNYLLSVLVVLGATLLGIPLHTVIEPTNLVMLFLVAVVLVAVSLGRGPSMLASLLSVLAFDYFYVDPKLSLEFSDTQYLITFFGLLAVGLVISNLASLLHDQVDAASTREAQTVALYNLSRELSNAVEMNEIFRVIIGHIFQNMSRDVAILLPGSDGLTIRASSPDFALNEEEMATAVWAFKHEETAGRGTDTLPNREARYLPLKTSRGVIGVLGVKPVDTISMLSPSQQRLLEGFASLSALAIERGQLAEQARQAEVNSATEKLQTALLNSISHDLRTPLASITGVLSSLKESENLNGSGMMEPATRIELVDTALGEAERLNRLVGNLLDMTRLEAGAMRINREPCDFEDVIGTALAQRKKQLVGHPVKTDISANLPLVPADYILMNQVLINLIENASKYSPPGSPIEIKAVAEADRIIISVLDRGFGVPPEDLERIFGKFYRVQRKDNPGGTGLGLSICKGIVEAHGGTIWATNRPESGLDVSFTIPLSGPNGGETHV